MQAEMLGLAGVGATRNALTKGMIESFEIPAPVVVDEQRAIAHILGTLDDKIELNRRMNETLEAIARAMFKSWFVDFDPVRAKMNGEPPESICQRLGLTPDLIALFPDRLVDSELGEMPEGWKVMPLEQLTRKISKGTTPTKQDISSATDDPIIPFIKVKDINETGEVVRDGLESIPMSVHQGTLKRSILEAGDILFSIAGTIGRVAVVEPDLANANTNQAVAFIRLKDSAAHFGLCLQHLKSERLKEAASASVVQGVQANVSLASLGTFKIVVPEDGVLELWNKIFDGCYNKMRVCAAESRTLATTRDSLLPKLLSGELCVPVTGDA
jgi:type I restriction enzyme S subunit